jgi:hypothetical protein
MKTQFYLDSSGPIRTWEITEEGYLIVEGQAGKEEVLSYHDAPAPRKEFVPYATLQKTAEQLPHKPLTNEHPKEGLVHSKNVKGLQIGEILSVRMDEAEKAVNVRAIFRDAEAVDDVISGRKRELSFGYWADVVPAPTNLDSYDLIQINRRYNHLALTKKGRGTTRLRLDSDGQPIQPDEEENMKDNKPKTEQVEAPRTDSQEPAVEEAKTEAVQPAAAPTGIEAKLDLLIDLLSPRQDSQEAPEAPANEEDDFRTRYAERRDAEALARRLKLDEKLNLDSMETQDIKAACVEANTGQKLEGEALQGAFAVVFSQNEKEAKAAKPNLDSIRSSFANAVTSGTQKEVSFADRIVDTTKLERQRSFSANQ